MGRATYMTNCPHCGAKNAAFISHAETTMRDRPFMWNVYMTCSCCDDGIIVSVFDTAQHRHGPTNHHYPVHLNGNTEFVVAGSRPEAIDPVAPADTPNSAAKPFVEAKDNLQLRRYETCGILCRKSMDIATKIIRGEAAKSETLYIRIDALANDGLITRDLKDWAHAVRLDGNQPIHSDVELSEDEAKDIVAFTEAFLMYAFTLPAMVGRRQQSS